MSEEKKITNETDIALNLFKDLALASIDYYLENQFMKIKTEDFDSDDYFNSFRIETLEHFHKGQLMILKQCFFDLAQIPAKGFNQNFFQYLQDKTKIEIGVSNSIFNELAKELGMMGTR